MRWLLLVPILTSCAVLQPNHSNDPKTCQERAAYHIVTAYPDPDDLAKAIAVICGQGSVFLPGATTTTLGP